MKTWVRKTLSVGVLAAGALLLAPSAAHADVSQETSHNNGILNGTQLVAPVSVPVNVVGNAIGVAGEAGAAGAGWNKVRTEGGKQTSKNNNGILNGTQAYLPVSVPVNVVGNAVAVLGQASAIGTGVNGKHTESARTESGRGGDQNTSGNNGIANGTQIYSPIDIPINICGNSLALLGQAHAAAVCTNKGFGESGRANQVSQNNNGIANGTQVYAPVSLPVNLSGNAIGVLGSAGAAAASSNESGHAGGGIKQTSKNNNGILNGTQIAAPVHVPVNVCGNALSILGASKAAASCSNDGNGGHHGGNHNGGNNGGSLPDSGEDNYSSPSGDKGGRNADARTKTTEQSPVSDVTNGLSGLGGITLLDTLG